MSIHLTTSTNGAKAHYFNFRTSYYEANNPVSFKKFLIFRIYTGNYIFVVKDHLKKNLYYVQKL